MVEPSKIIFITFFQPSTGLLSWWTPLLLHFNCDMEFSSFPLDTQTCQMRVGSTRDPIDMQIYTSSFKISRKQIKVLQHQVAYKNLKETIHHVRIKVKIILSSE